MPLNEHQSGTETKTILMTSAFLMLPKPWPWSCPPSSVHDKRLLVTVRVAHTVRKVTSPHRFGFGFPHAHLNDHHIGSIYVDMRLSPDLEQG